MAIFFQMHSQFDWSRYCWCIEGARRLDTLHSNTPDDSSANCYAETSGEPLLLSQARPYAAQQFVFTLYLEVLCTETEKIHGMID